MAFFDVEFPRTLDFKRLGGPGFSTAVVATQSGQEQRNRNWFNPRAQYSATLLLTDDPNESRIAAHDPLETFFLLLGGMANGFRFFDELDCEAVNEPMAQVSGDVWQLQKTYSLGGRSYVRAITKPITSSVIDYQGDALPDTVVVTGATIVSIDYTTGQVVLSGVSGTPTASFLYHIPVRLTSDKFEPQIDPSAPGARLLRWHSLEVIEVRLPDSLAAGSDPAYITGAWSGARGSSSSSSLPSGGGGGPAGPSSPPNVVDMRDWCLMPLPARASFHMNGADNTYYMLDTDSGYPAGYPTGVFFWMKAAPGNPWDIEKYDASYIYHWITEDGDAVDQSACMLANRTPCWDYSHAYKRFLIPVPILPRMFTLGSTVTIDTPGPNQFRRTTNCEGSFALISLGDVRAVTTGPYDYDWGGSIGSQPTIQNDYYYGGTLSSGVFIDKESTFYVQGFGRFGWKYYKLIGGSYRLQQASVNNLKVAGGAPIPNFPCGPGQSWF